MKGETLVADLKDQLETRDAMLRLLKNDLHKAQDRMKAYADKHRREVKYVVADVVWL